MKALTDIAVQRLKAPTDKPQVEYFDPGYPGFALRVGRRRKSWVAFIRNGGKLQRKTLGIYPAMSLQEAREAWRQVRNGTPPVAGLPRGLTFEAAFEQWMASDKQAKNRSSGEVRRRIEKDILPAWKDRGLADITRADAVAALDAVGARAPIVANRIQSNLFTMFRWHLGRGAIAANPIDELPKQGVEQRRKRVLTEPELAEVWHAADKLGVYGPAIRMLILTGARLTEITELRWSEIRDGSIHLTAERTKNGEPHIIPLSRQAIEVLASVPRIEGSDFVFTTNGRNPIGNMDKVKKRLPSLSTPWVFHDFRRTVATIMNEQLGILPHVADACLGHVGAAKAGVAGVYNLATYTAAKREALAAWGARIMGLVS